MKRRLWQVYQVDIQMSKRLGSKWHAYIRYVMRDCEHLRGEKANWVLFICHLQKYEKYFCLLQKYEKYYQKILFITWPHKLMFYVFKLATWSRENWLFCYKSGLLHGGKTSLNAEKNLCYQKYLNCRESEWHF